MRLVYVVDRRLVVDAVYERAKHLADLLLQADQDEAHPLYEVAGLSEITGQQYRNNIEKISDGGRRLLGILREGISNHTSAVILSLDSPARKITPVQIPVERHLTDGFCRCSHWTRP